MHLNVVILTGNLCADPELRFTNSGKPVCNFRMATNEGYTDASGKRQERTDFHRIVVWGKQAESCKSYIAKGRLVTVEGRIHNRDYTDNDGNKRNVTEIVANRVHFGPRTGGAKSEQPAPAPEETEISDGSESFNE